MKVALIGATGKVGQRLMAELESRGHAVVAIARSGGDVQVDANDPAALGEAIRVSDAVMLAGRFVSTDAGSILDAMKLAG